MKYCILSTGAMLKIRKPIGRICLWASVIFGFGIMWPFPKWSCLSGCLLFLEVSFLQKQRSFESFVAGSRKSQLSGLDMSKINVLFSIFLSFFFFLFVPKIVWDYNRFLIFFSHYVNIVIQTENVVRSS